MILRRLDDAAYPEPELAADEAWWHDVVTSTDNSDVEWMAAEDPLFILYTSGSTGAPKGAIITRASFALECEDVSPAKRDGSSGVAVLVNDMTKHVALKHIQPILDAEMDKCDLLCYNCQVSRYDRGRGRWDETPCE